jgi:hypothetical protein
MKNDFDNSNPWDLENAYTSLCERDLDDLLHEGETEQDKEENPASITANNMLVLLIAIMHGLTQQLTNLSLGQIQRITIKLGVAVINHRFGKQIKEINDLHDRVNKHHDKFLILVSYDTDPFKFFKMPGHKYRKISMRIREHDIISNKIAEAIQVPESAIAMITLLAGLSKSSKLVDREWLPMIEDELNNFGKFLERQEKTLEELL